MMHDSDNSFYNDPIFKPDVNYEKHQLEKLKRNTMPKPKMTKNAKKKPFHSLKLREIF
jgi:hypothetical protein